MNKYNSEGYLDVTAYEALTNICKEEKKLDKLIKTDLKWVYICSQLRGDIDRNIRKANGYCRFASQNEAVPLAPHTIVTQYLDDDIQEEREAGMYIGLQMLKKCDELWVFGLKISEGMRKEIHLANKLGLKIRRFNDRCEPICDGDVNGAS